MKKQLSELWFFYSVSSSFVDNSPYSMQQQLSAAKYIQSYKANNSLKFAAAGTYTVRNFEILSLLYFR
jgi:hypothetical protein